MLEKFHCEVQWTRKKLPNLLWIFIRTLENLVGTLPIAKNIYREPWVLYRLQRSNVVTSLLANGITAFKWKLHSHWLKDLQQCQIAVVILYTGLQMTLILKHWFHGDGCICIKLCMAAHQTYSLTSPLMRNKVSKYARNDNEYIGIIDLFKTNNFILNFSILKVILMVLCKTLAPPFPMHGRYCSLTQSYWYIGKLLIKHDRAWYKKGNMIFIS